VSCLKAAELIPRPIVEQHAAVLDLVYGLSADTDDSAQHRLRHEAPSAKRLEAFGDCSFIVQSDFHSLAAPSWEFCPLKKVNVNRPIAAPECEQLDSETPG
jgi:hypothetical protein